jgi:hypothetical protein
MTMRALLILVGICFSVNAFAQDAAPKTASKPPAHAKPKEPTGCTQVGKVRGIKVWAGDCVASEQLRGSAPTAETSEPPLLDRAGGAIPSGQK